MEIKSYQLEVKDSIFDPFTSKTVKIPFEDVKGLSSKAAIDFKGLKIYYIKRPESKGDRYWYRVWIYLTGNDVVFVKRVTYNLHSTFENPVRVVDRRPDNPNCAIDIWTWGVFNVRVEIEDISGRILYLDHYLTYNEEIKKQEKNKEVQWIKMPA